MKKIQSLFARNYDTDRLVRNEVVPGSEWVLAGEGRATRKYDGTCCMVNGGELFKRYDAKKGKTPPTGFIPAQEPDPITGHWPGWLPVSDTDPADRYHIEAFVREAFEDGTYELCGPKIQGNLEKMDRHMLIRHGNFVLPKCPRDFEGLKEYLEKNDFEGIVFHHSDGRMVKIKKKYFGFKR